MKNKSKNILKVLVIILLGAAISIGAFLSLTANQIEVVLLKDTIEANTVADESMFDIQVVDKDYAPKGYILKEQLPYILGKTFKYDAVKGSYVYTSMFYTQEEYNQKLFEDSKYVHHMISASLKESVGNTLENGDKVNLSVAMPITDVDDATGEKVTHKYISTFLQNVKVYQVVTVDDEVQGIVFELLPKDAQELIYAEQYGSGIYISLVSEIYEETKINTIEELEFLAISRATQNQETTKWLKPSDTSGFTLLPIEQEGQENE